MLKRASRKLRSTPAKTLMYIILFLVLFLAIFSMLISAKVSARNKRAGRGRSWKIMYCICDPVRNRRKVH